MGHVSHTSQRQGGPEDLDCFDMKSIFMCNFTTLRMMFKRSEHSRIYAIINWVELIIKAVVFSCSPPFLWLLTDIKVQIIKSSYGLSTQQEMVRHHLFGGDGFRMVLMNRGFLYFETYISLISNIGLRSPPQWSTSM